MRVKTIRLGKSILGKIKYADEPNTMDSSNMSRDCPTVDDTRRGISPRARPSSRPQEALQPYRLRPVVNEAVDNWRSRAHARPLAPRSTLYHGEHEEQRSTSRQATRGKKTSASRYRGTGALDINDIVLDFEKLFLSDAENDESIPVYEDSDNYFPNPKITFFIDRPANITCSICRENKLHMKSSLSRCADTDTVILPCSHAFCRGCLDTWMEAHMSCPLCRLELVRKSCGHAVEPRVVAQDTVMSLPPTVSEGGKIAATCWSCRQHDQAEKLRRHEKHFRKCRQLLLRCRQEVEIGADRACEMLCKAEEAFRRAQREVERFSKNITYENSSHMHLFW